MEQLPSQDEAMSATSPRQQITAKRGAESLELCEFPVARLPLFTQCSETSSAQSSRAQSAVSLMDCEEGTAMETQSFASLSNGLECMELGKVRRKRAFKRDDKCVKTQGGVKRSRRHRAPEDVGKEKRLKRKLEKRHNRIKQIQNEISNLRRALSAAKRETKQSVESPNRPRDGCIEVAASSFGHQEPLSKATKKRRRRKRARRDQPEPRPSGLPQCMPVDDVQDSYLNSLRERLDRFPPEMRREALKKIRRLLNHVEFGKKALRKIRDTE